MKVKISKNFFLLLLINGLPNDIKSKIKLAAGDFKLIVRLVISTQMDVDKSSCGEDI